MNFKRKIFSELKEHLENRQITVLTGMRRVGKTTLVKQLLEKSKHTQKLFFDLERLDHRQLFSFENYEQIIKSLELQGIDFSKSTIIALDEIQLLPNITSVIKYLYDNYTIKFIITGSSSYYIKNKFQESLAGRKKIFEIYPLDFGEFLTFKKINYKPTNISKPLENNELEYNRLQLEYEEFIEYGGFPEVVLTKKSKNKKDLLQDIINSYINIDLIQIADIRKTNEIGVLIKLLASRIGTKLDISKLSSLTKLSRQTVENYIYLLEQTYFIKTIPVYSLNIDREIVKARKIYFIDNGIATMFSDLSSGSKFENAVFNQLKYFGEINYYQLKTGREIDFLLNKEIAFEVKETAVEIDYNKLVKLSQNIAITKNYIITKNKNQNNPFLIWGGMLK